MLNTMGIFMLGGRLEIAKCLIEAGANPSAVCAKKAWTPLSNAAESGCVELVEYLLKIGAWDAKLTVSPRLHVFSAYVECLCGRIRFSTELQR